MPPPLVFLQSCSPIPVKSSAGIIFNVGLSTNLFYVTMMFIDFLLSNWNHLEVSNVGSTGRTSALDPTGTHGTLDTGDSWISPNPNVVL